MEDWILETKPELLEELQSRAEEMYWPTGDTNCVKCFGPMHICTYCFTRHMLAWIMQYPQLVPEFLQFFNFDLAYHGYAKHLMELV
ncbi:hypothetical protein ACFL1B_02660 [Nanoarchaeota archaeon]